MLKTQYVTDHEKKVVKAKRGLFGYLRVFLAFAILNGIISASARVVIGVPVTLSCLSNPSRSEAEEVVVWFFSTRVASNPSRSEAECYVNAIRLRQNINLAAFLATSALVANKLNKDALKRYEDLEERT